MLYLEALEAASKQSRIHGCAVHVYATFVKVQCDGRLVPAIDQKGYRISDWTDGATVASYVNGERRDNW